MEQPFRFDELLNAFLENLKGDLDLAEFRIFVDSASNSHGHKKTNGAIRLTAQPASHGLVGNGGDERLSVADMLSRMSIGQEDEWQRGDLERRVLECHDCSLSSSGLVMDRRVISKSVKFLVVIQSPEDDRTCEYIGMIMSSIRLNRRGSDYEITRLPRCAPCPDIAFCVSKCFNLLDYQIRVAKPLMIIFFGKDISDFLRQRGLDGLYGVIPMFAIAENPLDYARRTKSEKALLFKWLIRHRQYIIDASSDYA